ncbi:MAG: metalloregulator ArsR/SmtB family transcription factor [Planctomycetota bacterium]
MKSDVDLTLAALADPTRRGMIDLLRKKPRRAGELAEAFEVTPSAMSRHLRLLRTRGLIEEERHEDDARVRVFRLRRQPFDQLKTWLERVESLWTDQLSSFKAHAEKRSR